MIHWHGLNRPKALNWEKETLTETHGKFYTEPFEKGFGITIGNSLRRVLLSSLMGSAISSVKIDGASHEFSTMPGVVEDVVDIILNLKGVRVKLYVDNPITAIIDVSGEKVVRAGDVNTGPNAQILNPDHYIATIETNGKLFIEMEIKWGRGYVSASENKTENQPIGTIAIDSIFSPVIKVRYSVEEARIGQITNYDRLIFELWTDGSITPEDAIANAAKILKEHFRLFINFEEVEEEEEVEEKEAEEEEFNENLLRNVEELELSVRAYNCLKSVDIKTIADLVQKTDAEMLKTKNFGKKSLDEIQRVLESMNLKLGMKIGDAVLEKKAQEANSSSG